MVNPNNVDPSRGEREPSAEDSAIAVEGIEERRPQLQRKLTEYRQRVTDEDMSYVHPAHLALYGHFDSILKASILETVLTVAAQKQPTDKVYLHELVVPVQESTGLDVVKAATIPFQYNPYDEMYEPDIPRLFSEAGRSAMAFTSAYMIIRAYCTGDLRGIEGGTGLPEV